MFIARKSLFRMRFFLFAVSVIAISWNVSASEQSPPQERTEPDADLPKVLIIGDSISGGYTRVVVKELKGRVHVERIPANGEHTGTGLKKLDEWLGDTQWDVIHFNWGLWDLCYRHPDSKVQGRRDKVKGKVTTPLNQYEENLQELVKRLKETNAKLIWAHTTVVPEGEAGRIVGDDVRYNEAAARVMEEHEVWINDLHTLTKSFEPELFSKPGDVHYSHKGYRKLAEQVVSAIEAALGIEKIKTEE